MVEINTSIKNYYNAQRLDQTKVDVLIALAGKKSFADQYQDNQRAKAASRLYSTIIGLTAALLVAITLVITFSPDSSVDLNERVANEITMNHLKNLAVEYSSDDLEQISAAMTKLGFTLRRPSHSELEGLTLIGARYCSIQGQIAAQLKYQDQDNEIITLYQTKASPQLENLVFNDKVHNGVQIIVWREMDIVYGLARLSD